jgi:tRNA(fMet)-specific endonuclease VapC
MKQALLDTDTLSFFFRNHASVVSQLETYLDTYGYINLSVITYYEVLNGLLYKDARRQLQSFEQFVALNKVIPLDQEVAGLAADIFADLRKKGQTLDHNDVLIAATALIHDMVLVTNNTSHFQRIPKLSIENWVS